MLRPTGIAAALLLSLALLATPAAAQQGDPFTPPGDSPLTQTPQQPAPVPPQPFEEDEGGLEGWQVGLLLGATVLVLGAIATSIVRDARRAAPVDRDAAPRPAEARAERDRARKRSSSRRKGKAVRAARRRNR